MYELHKQDMKREMGKGQQTDIDINIDMASYQQTKFKKKRCKILVLRKTMWRGPQRSNTLISKKIFALTNF